MAITKTPITTELAQKNKVQTKILSSNVTSDGTVSDLTFNNLKTGKLYSYILQTTTEHAGTDPGSFINVLHNGNIEASIENRDDDTSVNQTHSKTAVATFVASASQVTVETNGFGDGITLEGSGSKALTFEQLIEWNDLEETTEF